MYAVIFLLLIFSDVIEGFVPMANYWDELATFFVLCWGAWSFWKNPRMSKGELVNWILLIALMAIGVLGNIFHPGLQTEGSVFFRDMVALGKFPAIFFVLERRSISQEKQQQIIATIAKISRWLMVVTLAAVVLGLFVDLGFYTGEVRLVPTFKFIFTHPTFYVSSYVMLAAAMMAESVDKNRLYLLIDCVLLFMAQRSKGYMFIVVLLVFVLLGEKRITKILSAILGTETERVKPTRILLTLAGVLAVFLLVAKDRFLLTLSFGMNVPRVALHIVGVKILMDFFPLGSGFGTFASYLSGRHYSNIYELYGISETIGMTREEYHFISDVFWPYIYGQFGIFGLIIYVKLFLNIFFRQYRAKITDASRIAAVAVWIYAMVASTSEAYFTNGTGVQMALFLGIFLGYGCQMLCPERKTAADE